jgi:hypothetical protein
LRELFAARQRPNVSLRGGLIHPPRTTRSRPALGRSRNRREGTGGTSGERGSLAALGPRSAHKKRQPSTRRAVQGRDEGQPRRRTLRGVSGGSARQARRSAALAPRQPHRRLTRPPNRPRGTSRVVAPSCVQVTARLGAAQDECGDGRGVAQPHRAATARPGALSRAEHTRGGSLHRRSRCTAARHAPLTPRGSAPRRPPAGSAPRTTVDSPMLPATPPVTRPGSTSRPFTTDRCDNLRSDHGAAGRTATVKRRSCRVAKLVPTTAIGLPPRCSYSVRPFLHPVLVAGTHPRRLSSDR